MGGEGDGVMNWEIGIDIYTLISIKWITNKNLLYKKVNKIKFKYSKKKTWSRSLNMKVAEPKVKCKFNYKIFVPNYSDEL